MGYLLDGIESEDAALQAVIATVEEEDVPGGKRNDFETAAAHILPKDPVVKRRLTVAKQVTVQVSSVGGGDGDAKVGIE